MRNKNFIILIAASIVIISGTTSISALRTQYDLLIIAPTDLCDSFNPLIQHKEAHGITSKTISLHDIFTGVYFPVQGRDDPERIKYFIKNALEQWSTTYIMLVGGKDEMPVRYTTVYIPQQTLSLNGTPPYPFITSPGTPQATYITDLYYADIYNSTQEFCDWDANNNSIFGEVDGETNIDQVDLTPDVAIGRILCHNPAEVETIITKIITYETTTYEQPWFKNLILCGGDTHPNKISTELILCLAVRNATGIPCRWAWEGEYESTLIANLLENFHAKKFFSTGFFGLRAKHLTTRNINNALNDGAGFLYFNLHGSPTLMVTYPPFNSKYSIPLPFPQGYSIDNIQHLINDDKLPIAVFCSCSTGDFDEMPNPIAWEFVGHQNGGSIASFACTTVGLVLPGTLSSLLWTGREAINVFEAYADGHDILGDIWMESLTRFLNDEVAWTLHEIFDQSVLWTNYLSIENWMLFGDPSLKIGGYP